MASVEKKVADAIVALVVSNMIMASVSLEQTRVDTFAAKFEII